MSLLPDLLTPQNTGIFLGLLQGVDRVDYHGPDRDLVAFHPEADMLILDQ